MTLRNPYEFDLDPPDPNGMKMISVSDPFWSAPGNSTYYLVRRFEFAEGDYTFSVHADDAATFWIGTSQLNSRMIASTQLNTPGEAVIHIPQGSYRLDVILQNLPAEPTPCWFTLLIKRGNEVVYASTADGWWLDDSPIADSDVPPGEDYRYNLPVFSVLPNWANGIIERLSWLTDIMDSETDAEQRRSVRRNARRSFEVNFLRQRAQRDRLDTFFVGVGPRQFMMPLWHEAVKMNEGIDMEASGVYFEDGQLSMREFRKGDLVFVNAGSPDDFDILEVGDVETNRFSWAFPPPRAWPPGTRIYPMRVATINTQAPKMSNITDTVSAAVVQFDQVEPYSVPAAWGGSMDGEPLFRYKPDRAEAIEANYNRRNYVLDNDSGVPVITDHGKFTTSQVQVKLTLFGRPVAYSFRQFLQSARGQAKHFYMPTFMQDIEPMGDIAASGELLIKPQGYYEYMDRPQPLRLTLAFQFRNGAATIYRYIENVTPVYKTDPDGTLSTPAVITAEKFTLDEPLPEIPLRDLKRISFIVETRFAQDSFELFHPTNGQEVVQTSLVFRQAQNPRITT